MKSVMCAGLLALAVGVPALAQGAPGGGIGEASVTRAQAEQMAGARFDRVDANHDGVLDAEEMAAMRQGGPGGGQGGPAAVRGPAGPIAKADFIARQLRRFDRMDGDHDGVLTKAERDAARAMMMQQRGAGAPGGETPPPPGN